MSRLLVLLALLLTGCATAPLVSVPPPPPATIVVTGNGKCRPDAGLTEHKAMRRLPERDTRMDQVYGLLLDERRDHKADIDDYNSLFNQCVDKTKAE